MLYRKYRFCTCKCVCTHAASHLGVGVCINVNVIGGYSQGTQNCGCVAPLHGYNILCSRWWCDRGSPGFTRRRCPNSWRKVRASCPNTPAVSIATGMRRWLDCRSAYFAFFLSSAWSTMAPASLVASITWDGAKVSGHVTSQARVQPLPGCYCWTIWWIPIGSTNTRWFQLGRDSSCDQWSLDQLIDCCMTGMPTLALGTVKAMDCQLINCSSTMIAIVAQWHSLMEAISNSHNLVIHPEPKGGDWESIAPGAWFFGGI